MQKEKLSDKHLKKIEKDLLEYFLKEWRAEWKAKWIVDPTEHQNNRKIIQELKDKDQQFSKLLEFYLPAHEKFFNFLRSLVNQQSQPQNTANFKELYDKAEQLLWYMNLHDYYTYVLTKDILNGQPTASLDKITHEINLFKIALDPYFKKQEIHKNKRKEAREEIYKEEPVLQILTNLHKTLDKLLYPKDAESYQHKSELHGIWGIPVDLYWACRSLLRLPDDKKTSPDPLSLDHYFYNSFQSLKTKTPEFLSYLHKYMNELPTTGKTLEEVLAQFRRVQDYFFPEGE